MSEKLTYDLGLKDDLVTKPTKLQYSHPRKMGKDAFTCRVCGARQGVIRKYGLNTCRRCFRENANQIGFKKYR